MSRISMVAAIALLASSGADATTVYRCHTAQGLSYQDRPCPDRAENQRVVNIGAPSVVKSVQQDTLGEWADQIHEENRQRELQGRAQNLQRQNHADTAEFAAMVEEMDKQRDASVQGVADVPPAWQIDQQQRQAQIEYQNRLKERSAKLRAVQSELNQSDSP